MTVKIVAEVVNQLAPVEQAAPWDNTGILVDSMNPGPSKNVLLAIDMTDEVVNECIDKKISCIVAYHPVIFTGIKSIVDEKLIGCIKHGISVYCPHTQLDELMNAWVLQVLGGCLNLDEAAAILKQATSLPTLRAVRSNAPIYRVIAGVGSAFKKIDFFNTLVITGEMGHHTMLECKRKGNSVIIMEHSNSERMFLGELKRLMQQDPRMSDYDIIISAADRDPVEFI